MNTTDSGGNGFFQGIPVYTGLPAWPTCADLLVDTDTSELLGLSYQVAMDCLAIAEGICAKLDPAAVRLHHPTAEEMKTRYGSEYGKIGRLEIVWSLRPLGVGSVSATDGAILVLLEGRPARIAGA